MKSSTTWDAALDWDGVREEILERYCVGGEHASVLADEYGVNSATIARHLTSWGAQGHKGDILKYYELTGLEPPAELHPKLRRTVYDYTKVERPPPELPKKKFQSYDEAALHWSDVHFPFEDPRAVSILYQITAEVRPTTLMSQGDMLDLWQISTHRPPLETKLKMHQIDMQESLDMLLDHLDIMIGLAEPGARRVYLHGNHEDRFDRLLADLQTNMKTLALMRLPKIRDVLNLDYLLGLSENGWESHSYLEGDRTLLHDRLLCIHGYRANKYPTTAHLQQYGKSVVFGHSHRIQNFTSRDLRGTDSGWNMGCLCDLNPHWRSRPDWHQGFGVSVWKEVDGEWFFNFEQVRIHDGIAIFRDKFYKG